MGKIIRNTINTPMGIVVKAFSCSPTCDRQSHKAVSINHNFWRERRAKQPIYHLTARPNSSHLPVTLMCTHHIHWWLGRCQHSLHSQVGHTEVVNSPHGSGSCPHCYTPVTFNCCYTPVTFNSSYTSVTFNSCYTFVTVTFNSCYTTVTFNHHYTPVTFNHNYTPVTFNHCYTPDTSSR